MTSDKDAAEAYAHLPLTEATKQEIVENAIVLEGTERTTATIRVIEKHAFLAGCAHVRSGDLVLIGQLQAELAHVRKEAEGLVEALRTWADYEEATIAKEGPYSSPVIPGYIERARAALAKWGQK